MPENPLLPNRKLQQLYATMLRARDSSPGRGKGLEALFATLAQQLEAGDAVVPMSHNSELEQLLRPAKSSPAGAAVVPASANPLAFATGFAAAAKLAAHSRLVVVLLDTAKSEPAFAGLLDHAQRQRLPLVIICPEVSGRAAAKAEALTWTSLQPVVKKLRFPILTVDGGDAVAMYRAMQESVLRARQGDGPALLWCLFPKPAGRGGHEGAPLSRLQRYMAARKISLPRTSAK